MMVGSCAPQGPATDPERLPILAASDQPISRTPSHYFNRFTAHFHGVRSLQMALRRSRGSRLSLPLSIVKQNSRKFMALAAFDP
jgi:hypothetical protein